MPPCCTFELGSLRVSVAGLDASIRAPRSVVSVLARTLSAAVVTSPSGPPSALIEVAGDEHTWRISGRSERSAKVMSATSALPQVAGAVTSSLMADVAESAKLCVWRAAVAETGGSAVAFVGDDWESAIVLAAHLHARGWRLLGGDYALIERDTMNVRASRKLLYVTLSHVEGMPLSYRRAVEASPWYWTSHDIAFYAIDPALVRAEPWSDGARLIAVLRVDGEFGDAPALERAGSFSLGGIATADLERSGIEVADVKLGDYASTCELVERWHRTLGER